MSPPTGLFAFIYLVSFHVRNLQQVCDINVPWLLSVWYIPFLSFLANARAQTAATVKLMHLKNNKQSMHYMIRLNIFLVFRHKTGIAAILWHFSRVIPFDHLYNRISFKQHLLPGRQARLPRDSCYRVVQCWEHFPR